MPRQRDFDIISLDIETGGVGKPFAVLAPNGQPYPLLSIGCVRLSDFQTFYTEIGYETMTIMPESMQVHGLNAANLNSKSTKFRKEKLPTAKEVDDMFVEWLKLDPMYREGKRFTLIPMGMNVGSFDMQFVHYWLPKAGDILGYRSVDLNSPTFIEAWMHEEATFETMKEAAKALGHSFAINHFGKKLEHHALYDAWVNMGYLHYLVDVDHAPMTVGKVEWQGGKPA